MRSLLRNQQPVFFKLYEGQEEIIDEYGNSTGSYYPIYGELQSAMLCVSPNKGSSEVYQFGSFEDYDRTMSTADTNCPIDENCVLWVDGADTDGPWNYIVKLVAPWKNSITYAIKQVSVTAYQDEQDLIEAAKEQMREALKKAVIPDAEDQAQSESGFDRTGNSVGEEVPNTS